MIFGVYERIQGHPLDRDRFEAALRTAARGRPVQAAYPTPSLGLASAGGGASPPGQSPAALAFTGRIYNRPELRQDLGLSEAGDRALGHGDFAGALLETHGMGFIERIEGDFALAAWDGAQGQVSLVRDRFGAEPLFYALDEKRFVFGSSVWPILHYLGAGSELDISAIYRFLLFDYNPGLQTFWPGLRKLRPGSELTVGPETVSQRMYWSLSYAQPFEAPEAELAEGLLAHLKRAVGDRLEADARLGVFVSGGMDSSTVLGLAKAAGGGPIDTFSYRCRSDGFDESHYARRMAEFTDSTHHEIEYTPQSVLLMPELAREMNEPFCECGINIATYLLGREAQGSADYVLTGDGGDELFGGHPVYEADKVARFIDPLPGFVKWPVFGVASRFPDSDKKLSPMVKLKRFAESMSYPPDLLSHRWRIHYTNRELAGLVSPELRAAVSWEGLLDDVRAFNRETDAVDLLDRSLYSDYQTLTDFYMRRGDLIRAFGVEPRYPLFDYRLAEFCARVPAALKVKGWFDTKYIFKKAMEKDLPHDIVYREDKLGHSIPLKNWLRENEEVRSFVFDLLSRDSIRRRGWFDDGFVAGLISQHLEKRRNNTHRLWALAVLEMWMREHVDSRRAQQDAA